MNINEYSRIARKITATLFVTQSLTSAANIFGIVSAIVGVNLSGNPAWAGVPDATQQVGTAAAAVVVGALMQRIGRRWGLSLGLAVGVLGAGLAVSAIITDSFLVFLISLLFLGVANAAMKLGRFAAAEVHPRKRRGQAISYVVVGGTVGAIVGPLLAGPSGQLAQQASVDQFAGPYMVAVVLFALAAVTAFTGLRPDPRDVGKEIAKIDSDTAAHLRVARPLSEILRTPEVIIAVSAMVFGQTVMAMLMGITSLHMIEHHHSLSGISLVISSHTFGMFAFSVIVGRLTDRWGRGMVIAGGATLLALASTLAPISPTVIHLSVILMLLGVGWNCCYVGGSTLLADQLSPAERASTQGTSDLLIGLSTATASLSGGLLFASIGFAATGIVSALVALLPLGLTGLWLVRRQRLVTV